jgi:hypothetical protein
MVAGRERHDLIAMDARKSVWQYHDSASGLAREGIEGILNIGIAVDCYGTRLNCI